MSRAYLNLARRPYVNSRPVVRLSILLWIVGIVFLAGNVWLYWDFLAGRGDTHARLGQVEEEIASTEARIADLEAELAGFDLEDQNERVAYLNTRIERRHFSWSRLFDALTTLMPDDVRLSRLSPSPLEDTDRLLRQSWQELSADDRVQLRIDGVARTDESIFALLDALFQDPAFDSPTLLQQNRRDDRLISFDLETIYDPGASADEEQAAEEPGPERVAGAEGAGSRRARPVAMGAAASAAPEVAR